MFRDQNSESFNIFLVEKYRALAQRHQWPHNISLSNILFV